jgi:plastocyanin
MRVFAVLSLVLSAALILAAMQQRSSAAPLYSRVIPVLQGEKGPDWKSAEKGDLKGSVKFSAKRPAQPMVIYLERVGEQGTFDVPAKLAVSQKGAVFAPAFAVLVIGQEAEFKNDEEKEIDHNVYFLGASNIDLDIIAQGKSKTQKFEAAGEVSIHCSIHKFMDAKYFIAPNPAFVVLAADATSFDMKGVPIGKYKLRTWQKSKRFKDVELDVEISKDAEATRDVEMTR